MLSRYTIFRRRPREAGPLPQGIRQDTRWRTHHLLRPTRDIVEKFLEDPATDWKNFKTAYLQLLKQRLREMPEAFDELVELARAHDVFLGCNCPTRKNPDVRQCHTWLALEFMKEHFTELKIVFPQPSAASESD